MLVYRKGDGAVTILNLAGSALPRAMLPGLLSALITVLLDQLVSKEYLKELLAHPYPFQPFAYIAAFALVFRTNVAYNRYQEAATGITLMASKWGDAAVEAVTFDELPRGKPDMFSELLARRRRFQSLILRRFSLMHALALQYVRRDRNLEHLGQAVGISAPPPYIPGRFATDADTVAGFGPTSRAQAEWQILEVLGGVTESEVGRLEDSPDRVNYLFTTIIHLCNQRRADGDGLGVDAPVLSRFYQLISDGMLGFRQTRKLEDIPFPFPYTQAITVMLAVFTLTFPVLLSRFANEETNTGWVGPSISFITVTSYAALHKVARVLEDPFVHPPNDLPANALQMAFNGRLLSTFDAVRGPYDAISACTNGDTNGGTAAQLKDARLWGQYADLEPQDVREATEALLAQWQDAPRLKFEKNVLHEELLGRVDYPSGSKGAVATPRRAFKVTQEQIELQPAGTTGTLRL